MNTIKIDGVIGTAADEISAAMVRDQLPQDTTQPIRVILNSEGGSVFQGFAIHDIFAQYPGPKTLSIESSAFSIASFIACAFDDVEITSNGYMMLHNPYTVAEGDDEEFAKQAATLGQLKESMVKAYAARSGKPEEEIRAILKNETYLNAQQSVEMGFAKRIAGQKTIGRALAKVKTMPHGVVSALLGSGSSGDNDSLKGKAMPESTPVAATLQEIKTAFPKAKADFIVRCLEKSLPLASVATAAAEEMMTENEDLKKQVDALKAQLAEAQAAVVVTDGEDEGGDMGEDPEMEDPNCKTKCKAKSKGVTPIAKARAGQPSARARWDKAVADAMADARGDKVKAVALANRNNPGLREAFLAEVNAR